MLRKTKRERKFHIQPFYHKTTAKFKPKISKIKNRSKINKPAELPIKTISERKQIRKVKFHFIL